MVEYEGKAENFSHIYTKEETTANKTNPVNED